ncbi:hypothetical protein [Maribacter hydrothermalis]|uniref:DUF3379 domain-containing protein n=1 Tax=Maribacter hydrothermalis TaxID=1836467 RepID=A0A1B7ZBM3_9FLAO|nr:hypothetical protein [Maribacter hydrothermalis]APQ16318.1 hypothetical protein BTR34_02715 [Maribacter hydrothermalis]OBR40114.1 hypothetical protein A9200_16675 [Maribacter hydrothermalis]
MKKDTIENLFNRLHDKIDFEEPNEGHQMRFLDKLNAANGVATLAPKKNYSWLRMAFVAAAITLLLTVGVFQLNTAYTIDKQVAKISPEASKTQFHFANLIEEQIKELNAEKSPETEKIINDTMLQLKKLQLDYDKMEQDLLNGGNSKLILSAMITNFQTRIDLLNEVMIQIENIKTIKNINDANYTI